jgi:hypothetical protein
MNQKVRVGSSYRVRWVIVPFAAAIVLLTVGTIDAVLWPMDMKSARQLIVSSGLCALATVGAMAVIARQRYEVEPTLDGLIVRDRKGERAFRIDQVICASKRVDQNYRNGVLQSTTRTFDLWVEDESGSTRFKLLNTLELEKIDPLAAFIERVEAHLEKRANALLDAGQPFEGEGWTLYPDRLEFKTGASVKSILLAGLVAADVIDGKLCIWRQNEAEPEAQISNKSANAAVLARLLNDRVGKSPMGVASDNDPLGRLLIERSPNRWLGVAAYALKIAAVAMGTIPLAAIPFLKFAPGPLFALLLFGLSYALICILAVYLWIGSVTSRKIFRWYEHGISLYTKRCETRFQFAEIDGFKYGAFSLSLGDIYRRKLVLLKFTLSTGNSGSRNEWFTCYLRESDDVFEKLSDKVNYLISERILATFLQSNSADWTDSLRYTANGLEYRARAFIGRRAPILIPYDTIRSHSIEPVGEFFAFRLWTVDRKKPLMPESVYAPNFYAGYLVLDSIRQIAAQRATSED